MSTCPLAALAACGELDPEEAQRTRQVLEASPERQLGILEERIWHELHCQPFPRVASGWRALFACCSAMRAERKTKWGNLKGAMRDIDLGLLLGGEHPSLQQVLHEQAQQVAAKMPAPQQQPQRKQRRLGLT